jgi:DNA-binding NarL/FixJ family response regulator
VAVALVVSSLKLSAHKCTDNPALRSGCLTLSGICEIVVATAVGVCLNKTKVQMKPNGANKSGFPAEGKCMIRVVLADDHTLVRAGIRQLLENLPDVAVVAETGDGREAMAAVEKHQPNLALMDITMPGLNGLDAASQITKRFPGTRIIILSMHTNEEYVLEALRAGVAGYLLKDAATVELELALKAVLAGETYLSPAVSKQVIRNHLQHAVTQAGLWSDLPQRQREILQLIAEGKSTKEMAGLLDISVKTVETHRAHLMDRLNIHDVAGLVRYAIRAGLISI